LIIPSYFVAVSHPESYFISYNLLAFVAILLITPFIFKKLDNVFWVGVTYLIGCSLNAIYLIIMSFLIGKRAFGFAGIMYVDLVGIGIIIAFSSLLFFKKFRFLFGIVTVLLIIALLFTQTRNSWISTGLVLLMLTVYYTIKNKKFKIPDVYSVKKLVLVVLSIIVIISIVGITNPNVFSRVSETKSQSTEELAVTMDFGSLATRFFIWKIAYSVFEANPIIGTGFHSFRFISYDYSNLDPFLYDTFVKNLTPHTTILALLADTGIMGFLGFVIFMYLTVKFFKPNY
jgi:O-antigen ligase